MASDDMFDEGPAGDGTGATALAVAQPSSAPLGAVARARSAPSPLGTVARRLS
jgi:hypothetical protein